MSLFIFDPLWWRSLYRELARLDNKKPFDSKAERLLFLYIRPIVYVKPQIRCGPYSFDLANRRRMVAFEMDGAYWHNKEHDVTRDAYTGRKGWKTIRVKYKTFMTFPPGVALLAILRSYIPKL